MIIFCFFVTLILYFKKKTSCLLGAAACYEVATATAVLQSDFLVI